MLPTGPGMRAGKQRCIALLSQLGLLPLMCCSRAPGLMQIPLNKDVPALAAQVLRMEQAISSVALVAARSSCLCPKQ